MHGMMFMECRIDELRTGRIQLSTHHENENLISVLYTVMIQHTLASAILRPHIHTYSGGKACPDANEIRRSANHGTHNSSPEELGPRDLRMV